MALFLAAAPFLDAFWARDLGALQRELAEDRSRGEERLLFEDLLKLVSCEPLEALTQPSPMRALVRAEEARRGAPATIWQDIFEREFFVRAVWNPRFPKELRWPDETERWPAETLLIAETASKCGAAKAGQGALGVLKPELLQSLPPEPAARAAYERAVLLWRNGSTEGAQDVDVAQLEPELRPAARFLRLERGLDPASLWIALAMDWPEGDDGVAVLMRAAHELWRARLHEEVIELTDTLADVSPRPAPRAAMVRYALWLRALAFSALRRDEEMLEALARGFALPGPPADSMRALGMRAMARRPLDLALLGRISGKRDPQAALAELGRRALAAGNLQTARAAADQLASGNDGRWRAEGFELSGEIAWTAAEPHGVQLAVAQIFSADRRPAVRPPDRDAAALQLSHALVVAQAGRRDARWERLLTTELETVRDQVHPRFAPQVEALLSALRNARPEEGEQPVALGDVDVAGAFEPPAAPPVAIDLPEPRSLLAIPAPDGSLRGWFDSGGAP